MIRRIQFVCWMFWGVVVGACLDGVHGQQLDSGGHWHAAPSYQQFAAVDRPRAAASELTALGEEIGTAGLAPNDLYRTALQSRVRPAADSSASTSSVSGRYDDLAPNLIVLAVLTLTFGVGLVLTVATIRQQETRQSPRQLF